MKNNDDFFGNGCGWIIVFVFMLGGAIGFGNWGYNSLGIPKLLGNLLFSLVWLSLVSFLVWRVRGLDRRNDLLRLGICPKCEGHLDKGTSTSSLTGQYTHLEEGRTNRGGICTYEEKRERVLHIDQYRCTSCKREFTHRYTSTHAI